MGQTMRFVDECFTEAEKWAERDRGVNIALVLGLLVAPAIVAESLHCLLGFSVTVGSSLCTRRWCYVLLLDFVVDPDQDIIRSSLASAAGRSAFSPRGNTGSLQMNTVGTKGLFPANCHGQRIR